MFADHRPPQVDGITIHLGDVHLAIDAASGCSMVIADPPWQYDNAGCRGNAADEYALDSFDQITHVLTASYSAAAANAYLLLANSRQSDSATVEKACGATSPHEAATLPTTRGMH